MIVMMSLTLMSLLTLLMSIHPLSRGKKGKVKLLESTRAKLELAHSDLLGKYNDLLKKHNESLILAKQVEKSHKKLKQEHKELAHKYQELEFAYEAIDPSLENFAHETIEKVNASTSCDDLLINANTTMLCPSLHLLGKRN